MKALVKKYAEKGIWMDDVPEPTVGINDVKIKIKKTLECSDLIIITFQRLFITSYAFSFFVRKSR